MMMNNKTNKNTNKKIMITHVKCKYCGYEWECRAENPKSCPLCKRYLIDKPENVETQVNDKTEKLNENKVNTKISVILISLLVLLLSPTFVLAATTDDNVTISVQILTSLEISVSPNTLNWGSLAPGAEGAYKNLTIENKGSVNVTNINAYMDTIDVETGNPLLNSNGQPYAINYSAGGFLVLKNSTVDTGTYYYVGRIEWNDTQGWPTGMSQNVTNIKAWGWYRNATPGQTDSTGNYLWQLGNGTNGDGAARYCNGTGSQFKIAVAEDRPSDRQLTPTIDGPYVTGSQLWGIFQFNTTGGPLANHCVAAYYDCTKIYIYKWDYRSPFNGCTSKWYIQAHELDPNEKKYATVEVWIPYGLPYGATANGKLTISATGFM